MRAVTDVEFFVLPADDVRAGMMRDWFPMALHLLEGLFFGMRNSQTRSANASGCWPWARCRPG